MPKTAMVVAECFECGKRTFVIYEDRKIGKDKIKGKCFACGAEKDMRF